MLIFLAANWVWLLLLTLLFIILAVVIHCFSMAKMKLSGLTFIFPFCFMSIASIIFIFACIGIIVDIIRFIKQSPV